MNEYRSIFKSLFFRVLIALPLFILGWHVTGRVKGGRDAIDEVSALLLGVGLIVLSAVLLAYPLAQLLAEPTGGFFYPGGYRRRRRAPSYGLADAKRSKGEYKEAMDLYNALSNQYPYELKPYVEMVGIAIAHLQDNKLAEEIYLRGMKYLKSRKDRETLAKIYRISCARFVDRR